MGAGSSSFPAILVEGQLGSFNLLSTIDLVDFRCCLAETVCDLVGAADESRLGEPAKAQPRTHFRTAHLHGPDRTHSALCGLSQKEG